MPLIKIHKSGPQSSWALWHITESLSELEGEERHPDDITNTTKQIEWMAGRMLLKYLVEDAGLKFQGIRKDDRGKPFLRNLSIHISLSHSYPYVAAQLESSHEVGIDIEQPKAKLLRVAHRVFSAAELQDASDNIVKNCIYWCAKESLYKRYGKRGLSFIENLSIAPFKMEREGIVLGTLNIEDTSETIRLWYEVRKDLVIVTTGRQEP